MIHLAHFSLIQPWRNNTESYLKSVHRRILNTVTEYTWTVNHCGGKSRAFIVCEVINEKSTQSSSHWLEECSPPVLCNLFLAPLFIISLQPLGLFLLPNIPLFIALKKNKKQWQELLGILVHFFSFSSKPFQTIS